MKELQFFFESGRSNFSHPLLSTETMLAVPWQVPPCEVDDVEAIYGGTHTARTSTVFEELEQLKMQVGAYKVEKGTQEWRRAVDAVDTQVKMSLTVEQPVNRAYYKMVEMIRTCIILPVSKTFHMCEAPGGFIQAIASEFKHQVREMHCASAIGTEYPTFSPVVKHMGIIVHECENNDICRDDVRQHHIREIGAGTCELITADGAIDNDVSPETAEQDTAALLASEIALAMELQKEGGTFVLKLFGMRLHVTLELIALLASIYKSVQIVKPFTSRSVNDERYLVCQGFSSAHVKRFSVKPTQLTKICQVSESWMLEIHEIAVHFAREQASFLRKALCHRHEFGKGKGSGKGSGKGRGKGGGKGRGRGFHHRGRIHPYAS